MISTLNSRLDRLEASSAPSAPPPGLSPINRLLDGLIAHHLGGIGDHESIAEGMARGLGYEKGRDLMDGLRADTGTSGCDDLNARWRDATTRLLALKGAVPDCDGETFAGTLEALFRELPDRLREHPFMAECEALFDAA